MLTLTLLNLMLYYILSSLMEIFLKINQLINTDNFWIICSKDLKIKLAFKFLLILSQTDSTLC